MKLIMSIFVIVGLLFGGSATVSAAQDDLPYEPLYQIKLMSEDVHLWLISDPLAQIEILMQQAQIRTEEMAALASRGNTPPAKLTVRAQERIQRALQLIANLDDASQTAALQQIRTRLQTQEQLMIQLQDGTCMECEPILQQTRDMLRTQLRQIESDLVDPETFQNQNQRQNQVRTTQTPQPTDSMLTPQGTCCTPAQDGTGQQNGSNNPPVRTPMPQNNTVNQDDGGQQNGEHNGSGVQDDGNGQQSGEHNGSGEQNGDGSGDGGGSMPGSWGQGGKP
jgi:hypothetical protein